MRTTDGVAILGRRDDRLAELYSAQAESVARLAYLLTGDRELARDLVQDAFVKVAGRFQHLRDPRAAGAYLRRTVINLCKAHWRRAALERRTLGKQAEAVDEWAAGAPHDSSMSDALRSLPARQRAAIVLRYYEDLSEAQTADALDCSVGAVKQLTHRAMEQLRKTVSREVL